MKYYCIASGSKGNCTLITSKNSSIIIDCGCSKHYLENAFKDICFDYRKSDALLLTHSHSDHISQIKMFMHMDIYADFTYQDYQIKHIEIYKPFKIKDFTIVAFPLSHDCENTVGYIISDGQETLVCCTDTGYINETNRLLIKNSSYYIFESNHDEQMLMETSRPIMTKKRILSKKGHMSNDYASDVLCQIIGDNTKEIALAHISQQANDYLLAKRVLIRKLEENQINYQNIRIVSLRQNEIYYGGQ